ncbi:hypothetical protein LZ30DRAFT_689052 [Colletotrichum cereale]|nr:hypothetical protein LZ30DRAFT_689052 [Colletotrichum cereale]
MAMEPLRDIRRVNFESSTAEEPVPKGRLHDRKHPQSIPKDDGQFCRGSPRVVNLPEPGSINSRWNQDVERMESRSPMEARDTSNITVGRVHEENFEGGQVDLLTDDEARLTRKK